MKVNESLIQAVQDIVINDPAVLSIRVGTTLYRKNDCGTCRMSLVPIVNHICSDCFYEPIGQDKYSPITKE